MTFESQHAELLPAREALNWFNVDALNIGAGVNIDSDDAKAIGAAKQTIVGVQSSENGGGPIPVNNVE